MNYEQQLEAQNEELKSRLARSEEDLSILKSTHWSEMMKKEGIFEENCMLCFFRINSDLDFISVNMNDKAEDIAGYIVEQLKITRSNK